MVAVTVTSEAGAVSTVEAEEGTQLMETLRDEGTSVQGTCGGMMSCGTCHVYVDTAWADKLPPKSEDEAAMLEAIGDLVPLRPTSRLSCQIGMHAALQGLAVEIAPPV